MSWTKAKVEKAWRIFKAANKVIADALEVPPDELEDLICGGVLPQFAPVNPHEGMTDEQIAEANRAANSPAWLDEEPPSPTPEIFDHLAKRATLADLAPPSPEVVLEAAAPIIDKPIEFNDQHAQSIAKAERDGVGKKVEEILRPLIPKETKRTPPPKTFNRGSLQTSLDRVPAGGAEVPAVDIAIEHNGVPDRRSASRGRHVAADLKAGPQKFYLMSGDKYLHESCTGLTDKPKFAWCQPEARIAAVRKKFPETIDYREVPAL